LSEAVSETVVFLLNYLCKCAQRWVRSLPTRELKGTTVVFLSKSLRECAQVGPSVGSSTQKKSSDAGAFLRTGPPPMALRISVMALCGRELVSMDADRAETNSDISTRAPGIKGLPPSRGDGGRGVLLFLFVSFVFPSIKITNIQIF